METIHVWCDLNSRQVYRLMRDGQILACNEWNRICRMMIARDRGVETRLSTLETETVILDDLERQEEPNILDPLFGC